MTNSEAKIFGSIFNTNGNGIINEKNAKMTFTTGLIISVLPP